MATLPLGTIVHALFAPQRGFVRSAEDTSGLAVPFIVPMVTIDEGHFDEAIVTDHPVEVGSQIADHAIILPAELRIVAGWSKSPNFSAAGLGALTAIADNLVNAVLGPGGQLDYIQQVYDNLLAIYRARVLLDIYTGKRLYRNMLIRGLSTNTTSETENAMIVNIECREMLLARTQSAPIPAGNQSSPETTQGLTNRGAVQATPSGASVGG